MIGHIVNQHRQGSWTEYSISDNSKTFEWTYENDILHGPYRGYTLTGKIESIGSYKKGKLDGVLVYFDLNGRPKKVELWKGDDQLANSSTLVFEKQLSGQP
jgi:antitoxin component YwqK of YwqJK toxin-antitoxin module